MQERILFEVFLPHSGKSYEFWIPKTITVADATDLMARILEQQVGQFFTPTSDLALFGRADGKMLDVDQYIGRLGLHNGFQAILV